MRNGCFIRQFAGAGFVLVLAAAVGQGQSASPRMRGTSHPPVTVTPPTPVAAPQAVPPPVSQPTSRLLEPAQAAVVNLGGQILTIHADNSSLSTILRDIGSRSGMRIEGLTSDERVFGSFGPGAPRDVIADLLNGTAYNVLLLGGLDSGVPRELILSPATHGGAAAAPAPAANSDENEPDVADAPPPQFEPQPEQQQPNGPQPSPGVKTPQQLFEQLQRMRQNQGQQPDQPQQ